MPILDRNMDSSDMTIHSHSGDCKEEISGKYTEYIEANRDALMVKCERVNNCIDGLLKDENILLLLKGDNLSLNKTCSLIYKNSSEKDLQNGKCTSEDRKDFREDLEDHLILQFDDVKTSGWKNVKKCLNDNYGDTERSTYVNDICRLAYNQTQICKNRSTHRNVMTFFNNHIQQLQCTCRSLQKGEESHGLDSLPAVIGGLLGGFFLLFAILAVIFICYRRRKSQKKKKKSPNVIYLPAPNSDNYPVYQELSDDKNYHGYGRFPTGNPPALPLRYRTQEDEPAYLEPVEAGFRVRPKNPAPGAMNPCYGSPPEYSERDTEKGSLALGKVDADNGYFQPLPCPPLNNGSDKNKDVPENSSGYETVEAVLSGESTDEAPKSASVHMVPVPAKRSGGDRKGLPSNVDLKQDRTSKSIDTDV